ncbi:gamma carbonic anhydrase family protein [Streptomyces sp. AJS327]|uniref:gamma carbonic anhydrase family protein n=1 Tax=Streptomyces sp. AJS327 TaxID=2545265 RepID=UPI0015DF8C78|nr:gamma carbonic anhydrase family protein [Streptomyces sp. AJS327]MBA0051139.1 gamma carbonic anhydrase family protein [Streptomyces sp. AJS327]
MSGQQAVVAAVGDRKPRIEHGVFTAPTSVVVGDVTLRAGSSVWYGAVLRGDCDSITLGADSNIQDNCTVHADPGFPATVGERVSVGHNAVLHGCAVEDDVLVGMGATVLNGATIGAGSLIAAQALVPQGMRVPPGSLVAGVPAKVKRELTEEEREGIRANAAMYRELARGHRETLTPVPVPASAPDAPESAPGEDATEG